MPGKTDLSNEGHPSGAYLLRVCPLDPPTAPNPWLIKGANIDFIKHGVGETAFLPSEPIEVNIAKGLSIEQDLSVSPGTPTLRIASIQPTASDIRLLTNEQSAAQVRQGDQNIWIGFYGENLGATEEPVHVGIRGSAAFALASHNFGKSNLAPSMPGSCK